MDNIKKTISIFITGALTVFIAGLFLVSCTPGGVAIGNLYSGTVRKVDDRTNYETRKKVEDSCRAIIVSYESDKLMYEQYKDSDSSEERGWAASAKIRANKTAIQYNEYILKNFYVWEGNIPADIKEELELIKD